MANKKFMGEFYQEKINPESENYDSKSFSELIEILKNNPENEEVFDHIKDKTGPFKNEEDFANVAQIDDLTVRLKVLNFLRGDDHYLKGYIMKRAKEEIDKSIEEIKQIDDLDKKIECIALFGYYQYGDNTIGLWPEISEEELKKYLDNFSTNKTWILKEIILRGDDKQRELVLDFTNKIKYENFPPRSGYVYTSESIYDEPEKTFDDQLTKYQFYKNIYDRIDDNNRKNIIDNVIGVMEEYFKRPIKDDMIKTLEWMSKDTTMPKGFPKLIENASLNYCRQTEEQHPENFLLILNKLKKDLEEVIDINMERRQIERKKLDKKAHEECEKKERELNREEYDKWFSKWCRQEWVKEAWRTGDDVSRYDSIKYRFMKKVYNTVEKFVKNK